MMKFSPFILGTDATNKNIVSNGKNFFGSAIQPKLTINQPNDIYEQEADAMADKVMRTPDASVNNNLFFRPSVTPIQRKCAHCEEEEKKVQRKEINNNTVETSTQTESYINSLSGGKHLSNKEKSFFEPRMGYDFSNVRIHANAEAAESAQSINALAYTAGNNIVFNDGQYDSHTESGKKLLAHELTHVTQQNSNLIRRQFAGEQAPDLVDTRDGAPNATSCGRPGHCPPTFCQPYPSENLARQQRDRMAPVLLGGIAVFVNSRVLPLWSTYLYGGSSPQNLTSQFGGDFTTSPTTARTTRFLVNAIRTNLQATPPVFAPGVNVTVVSLSSVIGSELTAINTPGDPHEMNFNVPSDIAGNLAGGIGTNQTTCRSGAQPSPFNDGRTASGTITVSKDAAGNLTIIPLIVYQVRDTIDLCPGDCGTSREQIATVPMSQFEATGISGDVPFTIDFPAITTPFTIPHP